MTGRAAFSRCRRYRYALWREWDASLPMVLFVGLNPSTADARQNDPTIRRCIDFARRWGYGSLAVGNLFALRTPYPRVLKAAIDPVGLRNDWWLRKLGREASLVIAAWGADGAFLARSESSLELFDQLWCLGRTRSGEARHPLYLRADSAPERF
jgi:hypothetical protein